MSSDASYYREKYARLDAAGVCVRCGKPRAPKGKRCEACRVHMNAGQLRRKQAARARQEPA
jgi:hypothetical protein